MSNYDRTVPTSNRLPLAVTSASMSVLVGKTDDCEN
jgi:hypothetical protein